MFKRILIATDGSTFSDKAAELAVSLAKNEGAELFALTVEPQLPLYLFSEAVVEDIDEAMRKYTNAILSRVTELAQRAKISCKIERIEHAAPHRAILDAAERNGCDLVVMGSHGRSGIQSLVLGSVTQKVLAHATMPVLVSR